MPLQSINTLCSSTKLLTVDHTMYLMTNIQLYTYSDSDVVLFHIYASLVLPPSFGTTLSNVCHCDSA